MVRKLKKSVQKTTKVITAEELSNVIEEKRTSILMREAGLFKEFKKRLRKYNNRSKIMLLDKSGEDSLVDSNAVKVLLQKICYLLLEIDAFWKGSYEDEGEIRRRVLCGKPRMDLSKSLMYAIRMYKRLPQIIDIPEFKNLVAARCVLANNKGSDELFRNTHGNGKYKEIMNRVRISKISKEDQKFMDDIIKLSEEVMLDEVTTAVEYLKAIQVILEECDPGNWMVNAFNHMAIHLSAYYDFLNYDILEIDRFNYVKYGVIKGKYKEELLEKEEMERARKIEQSYIAQ